MGRPFLRFLFQGRSSDFQASSIAKNGLSFRARNPFINAKIKADADNADAAICSLRMNVRATNEQISFVKALQNGRYEGYGNSKLALPKTTKRDNIAIDIDGHIMKGQHFWFEWLPPDLQELVDTARQELEHQFSRFVGMLRWTQDYQCVDPMWTWGPTLYWAPPYTKYYHFVPTRGQKFELDSLTGLTWNAGSSGTLSKVWRSKYAREPLGHELRIEAERLQNQSARSALLICCSALEVGLKQHIGAIVPPSEWLVMNAPTPPVDKILRIYLPQLHSGRVDWNLISPTFTNCKKMIEARNSLAHKGDDPDRTMLSSYLGAVRNVLYLLDYLRGEIWAETLMDEPVRSALGLPAAQHRRFTLTLMDGPDI